MNTQHTPGPWQAQYMTETHRIVGGGDDMGGAHQVAIIYHDPDPRLMERNPNAAADALLIATAPELLAALENLLSRAALPGPARKDAVLRERMISAREQARAAIAKATGGTQ
jgi:hypothetical protein